jgi:hypothetical protein
LVGGKLHRVGGPAIESNEDGIINQYYIYDILYENLNDYEKAIRLMNFK